METLPLFLVIAFSGAFCLWIERKLAWLSHISGICLTILLAIVLSSLRVIPHKHDLYEFFTGPLVPVAIALMAFGLRLDKIFKLPRSLLLIFCVGTLASMAGGIIAALLSVKTLGINAAKVAAQLTASYIGGNENAVAIARILDVPNDMFVAVFSVDSIVTSLWMIVTIATIVSDQKQECAVDELDLSFGTSSVNLFGTLFSITLAILVVQLADYLGGNFGVFHPVMYLTVIAIALSQIKQIHKLLKPSYLIGSILFVPFFFSTGAMSDPGYLSKLPLSLALMPFFIVMIHGSIIYSVGYFSKIPVSITSIASQSLVGGAGTAIAAARAKNWNDGIYFGLVLGLAGYAIANFCGLIVYSLSTNIINFLGLLS